MAMGTVEWMMTLYDTVSDRDGDGDSRMDDDTLRHGQW